MTPHSLKYHYIIYDNTLLTYWLLTTSGSGNDCQKHDCSSFHPCAFTVCYLLSSHMEGPPVLGVPSWSFLMLMTVPVRYTTIYTRSGRSQ